jgi:hypothetical protein
MHPNSIQEEIKSRLNQEHLLSFSAESFFFQFDIKKIRRTIYTEL